jgi:hypothetical protein
MIEEIAEVTYVTNCPTNICMAIGRHAGMTLNRVSFSTLYFRNEKKNFFRKVKH